MVYALNASMVYYGFGTNMWDIRPQENITKAYKVRSFQGLSSRNGD